MEFGRLLCRSDFLLLFIGIKNGRAILCVDVIALAVQLCRIVRDGKNDLQELAEAGPGRVISNLDNFGVFGLSGTDGLVVGRSSLAAGIARGQIGSASRRGRVSTAGEEEV